MFLDKSHTTNPPPLIFPLDKTWIPLDGGIELLEKKSLDIDKAITVDSDTIIFNKNHSEKFEIRDLVYYDNSWIPIDTLKDDIAVLRVDNNLIEVALKELTRTIDIRILICTANSVFLHITPVKAVDTMNSLSKTICERFDLKLIKFDWYFLGKICNLTDTIQSINAKPYDKLTCIILEHEIKTFKRFKQLDTSRGWYMSHTNPDAVTFIPSVAINLFGFGTYHVREGVSIYSLKYEIMLQDQIVKTDKAIIKRPDDVMEVERVYFNADCEPISVPSGTKITVVLKYQEYDDSSKLLVGTGGEDNASIEENEKGIFKVMVSGISGNGTDSHSGQIPELYYSLEN